MGSDQYCLKWNNHWANLVRVFNSLRHSETFVDVTIACEGRHLKAHRLILSACSPYFKELLVSHPDKHPIIILKDVRYAELQNLIQFIYNGEVSVEQHDLASLLCTARELQIKGLADNCISNSLPPSALSTKALNIASPPPSALKDSTNTSSILLPTKPKEAPTNVNVNANTTLTTITTTSSTATTTTATPSSTESCHDGPLSAREVESSSASGLRSHSPGHVAPRGLSEEDAAPKDLAIATTTTTTTAHHHPQHQTSSRNPPPLPSSPSIRISPSHPPSVAPATSEPSSREGSPLSKRRKITRAATEEQNTNNDGVSSLSDDVVPLSRPLQVEGREVRNDFAGPSGIPRPSVLVHLNEEPAKDDSNGREESQKTEVELLKEPKDKPPDTSKPPLSSTMEEPVNMQHHPEVILEEDDSEVVTTNGTSSPPPIVTLPPTPTGRESALKEVPKTSSLPTTVPPQISFLQQALAMGYPQPIHFLQSNLIDQQGQAQPSKASPPTGNQTLPPHGLIQAKNILNFVDLLKVMGASIPPPTSQAPGLQNSGGVGALAGSGHHHGPSPVNVVPSRFHIGASSSPPEPDRSSLTCHICARIMPSVQVLEEHVRIHEEEKPYKCEQCGQRYKYQSAFQRHQEQNHTAKLPGDKPYRCDVCGQCFKYHKSFTKHRANHDLLDNFMKAEPGEDGSKGAIRALQESYLQRLLHPSFATPPATAVVPPAVKEEITTDCSEDEGNKGAKSPCLVSSTSLPAGPFGSENGEIKEEDDDIDIDEIVPDVPGDGEEELDDGSGGRFFFCVQCKLTFRDAKSFDGHCRVSPGCSADTLKEVSVGGDISVSSVPSSVAPSPQGSPQPSQSTSQAGCATGASSTSAPSSSASLVFSSPPAMLYTLVSGLPQTSCFPNASTAPTILNFSKLVNFGGIPTLANAIRGSDSMPLNLGSAAAGLPGGVNSILGGMEEERPFKCPYCQKGFKGRENLKLHIRTHTGEKPYNCGVCGKAFGGRSDMNRHLRIHTGEKPYPCKVCGKKFARADYLSKHITTHLGIPFAKPVHSLQQSLQNLENMQNLQNLENLQSLQSIPNTLQSMQNLQAPVANLASVPSMQNLQGLPSIPSLQNLQSFPSLGNLPTVQNLQNLQSVQQPTQTGPKDEMPNFTK